MSSRRRYITSDQLADYVSTSGNDAAISKAEEIIDQYVGPQHRFLHRDYYGVLTAVSSTTLIDTSSDSPLDADDNTFAYAVIEIVGGTGVGQRKFITASDRSAKSLTIESAFSTAPDTTSAYKIYQLGKFPRRGDAWHDSDSQAWHKSIPEAVKAAVAAQVEYMDTQGADFFGSGDSDKAAERIGNYSYEQGASGGGSGSRLVAPKARTLLRGIINRKGQLIV